MEFIIVASAACLIFALCFVVFYFKSSRSREPAKLHMCGQGETCQCKKSAPAEKPFQLLEVLEKAKRVDP